MKAEIHLFILWEKARCMQTEILDDINKNFKILHIHEIKWDREYFSSNLTRFYGENLPNNSQKERSCGSGPFLLVVVIDYNPIYRIRQTSKGASIVNVNMFDSKEMYREWTGGGHLIHGTNSNEEASHDLTMLVGLNPKDYLAQYSQENQYSITFMHQNIIGHNGWESLEQLLYVMNSTVKYVILRNFECIPNNYTMENHGDIDLLVERYYDAVSVMNAKRVFKSKRRIQNTVNIAGELVQFDLRFIGDNYYDERWEKNIIKNRVFDANGFYKCSREDYYYSLIYHALIHKSNPSEDYIERLGRLNPNIEIGNMDLYYRDLINFLNRNDYCFVEPIDFSVYFNSKYTRKKMSRKKFILKAANKVLRTFYLDKYSY